MIDIQPIKRLEIKIVTFGSYSPAGPINIMTRIMKKIIHYDITNAYFSPEKEQNVIFIYLILLYLNDVLMT
jgi:hypothetical protein